ncbi:hypothetical protein RHSIM_Rhsim09G0010500 [Rhododendron simsii]|uniref:RING-CH-type domain-containing protein n=1 Tax=Rhododendron simsii TaxID=118357 RepID=A0A834GGL5_RHOSS|nr:hypothetical protein RHSIM_Rhsim09G0010500 [Rhododendron simsii]
MVDEFMICIDRLIASACLESVNERERLLGGGDDEVVVTQNNLPSVTSNGKNKNSGGEGCSKILRECRICQEEDEEHEMEAPCACNGTLKFAHRKCIQRWCNKKGDITCEICYQVYSPNYIVPPPRGNPEVIAIDIRQAWGPHIDLRDPRFLALTVAERRLLESEYDEYTVANNSSLACFRYVAIMVANVYLAYTPSSDALERFWDGTRTFNIFQCFPSSTCWFSSSMLCNGPLVLHDAKPKKKAELRRYQSKQSVLPLFYAHPMYAVPGQDLLHIAVSPVSGSNGSFTVRESTLNPCSSPEAT